ncbi:7SK snRNA methylphosphate capping enzyme-like [Silurus meridionalis]|nr:7SK snRNA methylphosphate capping enzyme-like [Silurus meridionalis]
MIEMSIEKEPVLTGDGAAAILIPPPSQNLAGPVKTLSPSSVAPVSVGAPLMDNMVLAEVPSNSALTEEAGHEEEAAETMQAKGTNKLLQAKNGIQSQAWPQKLGKRRYSMNVGFKHPGFSKRRRRANSESDPVLPSNFLLGGNIFDPLNLNSLLDEEVNRVLNAETPKSSPLPSKSREPVEILIPRDITDPLNLSGKGGNANRGVLVSPVKRRRHRNRHHGGSGGHLEPSGPEKGKGAEEEGVLTEQHLAEELVEGSPRPYELNTSINCRDEVVPPILPRRRSTNSAPQTGSSSSIAQPSKHRKRRRTVSRSERLSITPTPTLTNKQLHLDRGRSQTFHTPIVSGATGTHLEANHHVTRQNRRKLRRDFQYGTYTCYYGYLTPSLNVDPRLAAFHPEWFSGKKVLDIGCNVGHMTLAIAKNWSPAHILGLDVDGGVVHAARQNLRHFLSELQKREGNYVPDSDAVVMSQCAEYDVIVCLNVTRWVQLNWGDVGLQRLFRRVYAHLNPGGVFIVQPQPWSSYSKRKRLTETTHRNYNSIRLRPDQFSSYLTSEVGFTSYELISATKSCPKGLQRPIYLFYKGPTSNRKSSTRRGSDIQEEEREMV